MHLRISGAPHPYLRHVKIIILFTLDSSLCSAAVAIVQRNKNIGGVFTQNKLALPQPKSTSAAAAAHRRGRVGPSNTTYPPAAHIPMYMDIKYALNNKYGADKRKAIRWELTSLHNKATV
jgi:hypothetical protein